MWRVPVAPEGVPVPLPRRGVDLGRAFGDQPPETTSDALNVRFLEPGTGRRRLSTRPGLAKETSAAAAGTGVPVQEIVEVDYAVPGEDYSQLGNPSDGSGAEDLSAEWEHPTPLGDEVLAVEPNFQRDSVWLTADGLLHLRNRDGEEAFQRPLPLAQSERVAPCLAVSPRGDVFSGASAIDNRDKGRIWKLELREDSDGWDVAWEVEVDGGEIVSIRYDTGLLYVGVNDNDGTGSSQVVVIGNALDGIGFVQTTADIPYPVGSVAVGDRGLYAGCLPSSARGPQPLGDGFSEGQVDWTPHDMDNADERLHAWLDAMELGQYTDGARVPFWPDRRFIEGEPVLDNTERRLISRIWQDLGDVNQNGDPEGALEPRFSSSAAQSFPGLLFNKSEGQIEDDTLAHLDNGNALYSRVPALGPNFDFPANKGTTAGKLPTSTGIWPVTPVSDPHTFSVHMLFRWTSNGSPGVLWSSSLAESDLQQEPPYQFWAVTTNYDPVAAGIAVGDPLPTDWVAESARPKSNGRICLIRNNVLIAYGDAVTTGDDETRMALVTIVKNTAGASRFRVNGDEAVAPGAGFSIDDSNLISKLEVFGSRVYFEAGTGSPFGFGTAAREQLPNHDSFQGSMHEFVTIMGTSSASSVPHDEDFQLPTDPGDRDYEKVEGYLAWKWGIADSVLPVAHPYRAAPPSAGSGFQDSLEDETSEALRSADGILLKLSLGFAQVVWAETGSGIGYDLATGDDGVLFFAGPRLAPSGAGVDDEVGPRARILGKAIDRGLEVDILRESRGRIRLTGIPPDGEAFFIDDGVSTQWYEFATTATPLANPAAVRIDTVSASLETIAALVSQTLTVSTDVNVYAERLPPLEADFQDLAFYSREGPTETAAPILTDTAGGTTLVDATAIEVLSGMDGGNTADNLWEVRVPADEDLVYPDMRMAVDFDQNLWVPTANASFDNYLTKYRGLNGVELLRHSVGSRGVRVHAVALDPVEEDFTPDAIGPEFAWVATGNRNAAGELVADRHPTEYLLRLVKRTKVRRSPFQTSGLLVADGKIYTYQRGEAPAQVGGSTPFDPDALYVRATTLFGETFITDGAARRVYNHRRGTLRDWKVVGKGEIPQDIRILEKWSERLVVVGKDPFNWYMSAKDDGYDWDLFPVEPTIRQAVAGSLEVGASRAPDPINGFAPLTDDLAIILGHSTIHRMTGDPMQGGRIDMITDELGGAFGRAWTKDPGGGLFFFSRPAGVWYMSPDGALRELTRGRIERALRDAEDPSYHWRLAWSQAEHGLYVFRVRATESKLLQVDSWFWDSERDAWWPDRFARREQQPTCLAISDDTVILGCEDGFARRLDLTATTDDGHRPETRVLVGPLLPGVQGQEARFCELQLTSGKNSSPLTVSMYGAETDEELEEPDEIVQVDPGLAEPIGESVTAPAFWFQVAGIEGPWALESARVDIYPAGRKRRR